VSPEEAAWVRDHAWTLAMRRQPHFLPDTSSATYDHALALARCDCMVGVCWHCRHGEHKFCHARTVAPRPECWLDNRPLDYIRPTEVWIAGRACRSLCPCCPDGPPCEEPEPGQDALFDLPAPVHPEVTR
jgi:hypothetical protein